MKGERHLPKRASKATPLLLYICHDMAHLIIISYGSLCSISHQRYHWRLDLPTHSNGSSLSISIPSPLNTIIQKATSRRNQQLPSFKFFIPHLEQSRNYSYSIFSFNTFKYHFLLLIIFKFKILQYHQTTLLLVDLEKVNTPIQITEISSGLKQRPYNLLPPENPNPTYVDTIIELSTIAMRIIFATLRNSHYLGILNLAWPNLQLKGEACLFSEDQLSKEYDKIKFWASGRSPGFKN